MRSWRSVSTARRACLEDFTQFESIPLSLVEIGQRGIEIIQRVVPLAPLNPLADHVDRAHQLTALGGILGKDQRHIELPLAGLCEQPAADFLGAVVPEPGIEPRVPPADCAVALNVADQV